MSIGELMAAVQDIQGKKWAYLALGRTLLNEMESMSDDIQALPAEVSASEEVIRNYHALKRSLSVYLIQCGYGI